MKGEHRKPSGLLAGLSRLGHSKSRKQLAPEPSKWDDMYALIARLTLAQRRCICLHASTLSMQYRHIRFSALHPGLYVHTRSRKSFVMYAFRHVQARLAGSVCIREFTFE